MYHSFAKSVAPLSRVVRPRFHFYRRSKKLRELFREERSEWPYRPGYVR
jgi:hypothetical protein